MSNYDDNIQNRRHQEQQQHQQEQEQQQQNQQKQYDTLHTGQNTSYDNGVNDADPFYPYHQEVLDHAAGGRDDDEAPDGVCSSVGGDEEVDVESAADFDDPRIFDLPRVLLMGPRRGGKTSIQVRSASFILTSFTTLTKEELRLF